MNFQDLPGNSKFRLAMLALPLLVSVVLISQAIRTGFVTDFQVITVILATIITLALLIKVKPLVLVVGLTALPGLTIPGIPFNVSAGMLIPPFGFLMITLFRERWSAGGIGKVFLLFILASIVSLLWSELVGISAKEHLERVSEMDLKMAVFLSPYRSYWQIGAWILGFGTLLFAINLVRNLDDMRLFAKAFIFFGLLVSSYGYYEFLAQVFDLPKLHLSLGRPGFEPNAPGQVFSFQGLLIPRVYSTFNEPKFLGTFLLAPVFLSLSHWVSKKTIPHLFLSVYLIGALVLCLSTSAWLGFIVGFIVWVALIGRGTLWRRLKFSVPIILLMITILIITPLLIPDSSPTAIKLLKVHLERIIRIPIGSYNLADDYIIGWRTGWNLFTSNPLFGVGIGHSPFHMLGLRTRFYGVIDHVMTPYNLFLVILSETGALGFIPFIALLGIPSLRALKIIGTNNDSSSVTYERAILVGALAALAGSMVTYSSFGGARFLLETWLILALLLRGSHLVKANTFKKKSTIVNVLYLASVVEIPQSAHGGLGGTSHVVEVARHLGHSGAKVTVFSGGRGTGDEWIEYDGIQVRRFYYGRPNPQKRSANASKTTSAVTRYIRWPQRFLESLVDTIRIVIWARKHNVNLIYERASRYSIAGTLASRLFGYPLITEVNDLYFHTLTLQQSQAIVIPEPKVLSNRLQAKCFPLPWGVDIERIHPMDPPSNLTERLNVQGHPTVAFMGSFLPWHGTQAIVQSAPAVLQRFPETRFLMIGTGPDELTLKEAVKQQGLSQNFVFTGFVEHSMIGNYLATANVLLAPYNDLLKAEEGRADMASSLKIFEYMAAGKPVVVTEVGNRNGAVEHDKSGLVIENLESNNLANAICHLLENKKLAVRMGENARATVEAKFSWQNHSASLYWLFSKVLNT